MVCIGCCNGIAGCGILILKIFAWIQDRTHMVLSCVTISIQPLFPRLWFHLKLLSDKKICHPGCSVYLSSCCISTVIRAGRIHSSTTAMMVFMLMATIISPSFEKQDGDVLMKQGCAVLVEVMTSEGVRSIAQMQTISFLFYDWLQHGTLLMTPSRAPFLLLPILIFDWICWVDHFMLLFWKYQTTFLPKERSTFRDGGLGSKGDIIMHDKLLLLNGTTWTWNCQLS